MILDQGFDPTGQITLSAGFGGINSNQYRAQTFQVGMSGTLVEIDVFVRRFEATPVGGNLVFELRRLTSTGAPSNLAEDSLLQVHIPSTDVGTSLVFLPINVSPANLHVNAGDSFAIVLHASADTPSGLTYQWNGQNTNVYGNGGSFEQVVGNHSWGGGSPSLDLGFETFVSTVPEPGALMLSAMGALFLAGYWCHWRRA